MNDQERYRRAGAIFTEAIELETDDERAAFLRSACGDDDELRAAVRRLIDAEADADRRERERGLGVALLHQSLMSGKVVGDYRIVRVLGQGGMGVVYLAEQDAPTRQVAIKLLRRGAASPELIRRFRHEADILGRLTHPGIAHVYDAGTYDDGDGVRPYFAMEYIDGAPLTTYVMTHVPEVRDRLELFVRVCDAVHHAHRNGIIHRDLKPDNILVTAEGQPKILDFGVARIIDRDHAVTTMRTSAGQLIGTLSYMSPEQIEGDVTALDTRTDVYALGIVLYELLSGQLPYGTEHASIPDLIRAIHDGRRTHLSSIDRRFRGDLETIVSRATALDPDRRYNSVAELAADTRRFISNEPITARPAGRAYRLRLFARRNRALVAGLTTAVAALMIGAVASIQFGLTSHQHFSDAERSSYRLSIESAAMRQRLGDDRSSRRILRAAPESHRNWEWSYLWAHAPALIPADDDRPLQVPSRVAFTEDGTPIAAVLLEDGVAAFDVATGRRLAFVPLEDPSAECFNLSRHGTYLVAVGRRAEEVRAVSTDGIHPARTARVPGLTSLIRPQIDDSGACAVVLSADRQAFRVIDLKTNEIRSIAHANDRGAFFALNPEATHLAAQSQRGDLVELTLFDLTTGATIARRSWPATGAFSRWRSWPPAWSPSSRALAVRGTGDEVLIVDAQTLETRAAIPMPLVDSIEHTSAIGCTFPTETALYVSDRDGGVHCVDLTNGSTAHVADGGRWAGIAACAESGRILLSTFATARLVETQRRGHCLELVGHTGYAYMHAWSPDGTILATSAWDYTTRLWDAHSGALLGTIETWSGYEPCGLVFDGARTLEMLFTHDGLADERLRRVRLDLATGTRIVDRVGTTAAYLAAAPPGMRLNSRGVFIGTASGTAGDFNVVSGDGRRAVQVELHGPSATGTTTVVLDRATATPIWSSADLGDVVHGLNHDGTRLICGSRTGRVDLVDLERGVVVASRRVHDQAIYSAQFSPDESRIVTAGIDGVRILEGDTLIPLLHLRDADDYVRGASFSPDGTRLATVSGDGVVRLYDARDAGTRQTRIRELARDRAVMAARIAELRRAGTAADSIWSTLHSDPSRTRAERSAGRFVLLTEGLAAHAGALPVPDEDGA